MAEQVRLLWKPFFYWRILAIQSNLVSLHWQSISTFLTKFNLNAEVIKLAAKKQLFSRTHESWYHDCPMRHRRCLSTIVFSMKFVSSIKSNSTDSTFIQYNMVIKIDQIGNYYSELRPMVKGSWGIHGPPFCPGLISFVPGIPMWLLVSEIARFFVSDLAMYLKFFLVSKLTIEYRVCI